MTSPLRSLGSLNMATPASLLSALTSDVRLFRLEADGPLANVHVETFALQEALHEPWRMFMTCLADTPLLKTSAMRWQSVTLVTTLADGTEHRRTGLVEQAMATDAAVSFNRLSRYRLRLVPWFGLLAYDIRSQAWKERTLVQIIDGTLANYKGRGRWRWSACALAHLEGAPQGGLMSFCMQYRETRMSLVQRLLAEAGLTYRFEETGPGEPATMVILADTVSSLSCPEDVSSRSGAGLRLNSHSSVDEHDTVFTFRPRASWTASTVTASTSDYKTGQVITASAAPIGQVGGPNALAVDAYMYAGAYAWPDSRAADRALYMLQQALAARRITQSGTSGVRSLSAGSAFRLYGTPWDDLPLHVRLPQWLEVPDQRYLVTEATHIGINNLPADILERVGESAGQRVGTRGWEDWKAGGDPLQRPGVDQITKLVGVDDALLRIAAQRGYANSFRTIAAATPWRPLLAGAARGRLAPRPRIQGPLTATVVGPDGRTVPNGPDEIYTDKLGRVLVRFEFMGHPDNDPGTSLCSAWVQVAQPAASQGLAAQWIPRIGHEVAVGFIDDDADRPFVVCSLYNGRGEGGIPATPGGQAAKTDTSVFALSRDHRPAGQGNLTGGNSPAWHGGAPQSLEAGGQNNAAALSGIKTKEFGGEGFNQTVFDDTDQQQRAQLATTQHATQLNMGHLIHQADNHRGSFRGFGYELRTDAYGALRGAKGVLMSTYGTGPAEAAGDPGGMLALTKQYQQLTEVFSKAASVHQTIRLAAHEGSTKAGQSLGNDKQAPALAWVANICGMVSMEAQQAESDAAERSTTPGDDKVPHATDPTVNIAARGGLIATAGQDIALMGIDGVSVATGGTADVAVGGAMRLHTGQAIGILAGAIEPTPDGAVAAPKGTGLTLVAGKGDLSMQAQNGPMQLAAKGDLTIQSATGAIAIRAKGRVIVANSHGSSLTIGDDKIVFKCPGTYTVLAGMKSLVGPQMVNVQLPLLPRQICVECLLNAAAQQSAFARRA